MVQMKYDGVKKLHIGEENDDLLKFIEKEDSNSSVTTDSDEGKPYTGSIHRALAHLLTTNKFQITTMAFVIIDCFVVIAVVMVDLDIFQSQLHTYVPQILRFISLGIVSLFVLEVILKAVVLRKDYLTRKEELMDIVIILVTFALQVAFLKEEGLRSGVGLLIFLRLWRVTKIINNVIISVKRHSERRLMREHRLREALERELLKYREYSSAQECEIQFLRGLLRQHHIDYQRQTKPPAGQTIDVVAEVNDAWPSSNVRDTAIEVLQQPDT